ncbi:MAG: hypothetical protein EUB_01927 [Eubacterium sp.]|uniref:hypothetical protein n=1 Tax=Eubacterium sp. TaxID=142586 RepID=UPI00302AFC66
MKTKKKKKLVKKFALIAMLVFLCFFILPNFIYLCIYIGTSFLSRKEIVSNDLLIKTDGNLRFTTFQYVQVVFSAISIIVTAGLSLLIYKNNKESTLLAKQLAKAEEYQRDILIVQKATVVIYEVEHNLIEAKMCCMDNYHPHIVFDDNYAYNISIFVDKFGIKDIGYLYSLYSKFYKIQSNENNEELMKKACEELVKECFSDNYREIPNFYDFKELNFSMLKPTYKSLLRIIDQKIEKIQKKIVKND